MVDKPLLLIETVKIYVLLHLTVKKHLEINVY